MSGSYDKHVMFWDLRNMRTSVHDVYLDKQVWDFKFHGENLGISQVYDGYSFVEVNKERPEDFSKLVEYTGE